jgi:hypothetical protein
VASPLSGANAQPDGKLTMRIVYISDTHELHRELSVPAGDLFIHAGDFTFFSERLSMYRDFNEWLGELPHTYKLVVPGQPRLLPRRAPKASHHHATAVLNKQSAPSYPGSP